MLSGGQVSVERHLFASRRSHCPTASASGCSRPSPGRARATPWCRRWGSGPFSRWFRRARRSRFARAIETVIGAGGGTSVSGEGESANPGSSGVAGSGDAASGPGGDSADIDPARMLACQLEALPAFDFVDNTVVVEVRFANGVFADRRLDLFPSFAAVLDDRFGARVERLDFADEGSVARINAWVSKATRDAIPELVSQLQPDDVLVLANAVRFRGQWTHRFDPERTVPAPFHLRTGASVDVPTMHASELWAGYREDEGFQAIALPYGGGDFELVAVLPPPGDGGGRRAPATGVRPDVAGRDRIPALQGLARPAASEPGDRGVPAAGAPGAWA